MDGVILINKEKGYTSRDVVNIVSKHLNTKKVGHTGTLDPMATGVLAICVLKATKIVELITSNDKEYIAEVTLGVTTDTLDGTGNIIESEKCNKTKEEIEEILKEMIGTYEQEVPIYSAVKIKGKKLYEYARNNEEVNLPKRMVDIKSLSLVSDIKYTNDTVIFTIKCLVSKGTYIRSLIKDIATNLNTVGLMSELIRTKHGDFNLEDCVSIDEFKSGQYQLKSIIEVLSNYPQVIVHNELEMDIRNGKIIDNSYGYQELLFINNKNEPLSLYKVYEKDNRKIKPWKMFI
ncbi:MAG: tRNA pseudouridine(55) synthase TruB [Bacilli bacterium]|nr:tRNA pseudouridine(55) synthase TruB [Bacilli bacterium]MDD4718890.1 tRNA pseudouridine(55) synthase TruB [Bacilli bacterium]